MKNKLYIGFTKTISVPRSGCLFIDDQVRAIPRARLFDQMKHCFNPLSGMDYKKAREIAEVLYTIYPQGENTLTVRNGKRSLLASQPSRLDKVLVNIGKHTPAGTIEAMELLKDILISPVLKRVLCNDTNFSFNPRSVICARLNRAELGEFDALVLGPISHGAF